MIRLTPRLMVLLAALVVMNVLAPRAAVAAIEPRSVLKTYFETGDIPTEQQFANLIDSQFNLFLDFGPTIEEHSVRTSRLGIRSTGAEQKLVRFGPGETIGPAGQGQGTVIEGSVGASSDWLGESGFLGLEFELGTAGAVTTHYGFVQMRVDGPTGPTPFAIHVEAFAYQTDPDTPITTFRIPEPGAGLLLAAAVASLSCWVRDRSCR